MQKKVPSLLVAVGKSLVAITNPRMSVLELCLTSGGNGEKIRGTKGENGEERWSVYNFINAVCGKDATDKYGAHVYYSLIQDTSEHKVEVCSLSSHLKFPGRGQWETPCMTEGKPAEKLLTSVIVNAKKKIHRRWTRAPKGRQ
jgi:hypothetical protein